MWKGRGGKGKDEVLKEGRLTIFLFFAHDRRGVFFCAGGFGAGLLEGKEVGNVRMEGEMGGGGEGGGGRRWRWR